MSKEEFEGTLRSYGFKEDSEYKGVYKHPNAPIYTWYAEGEMVINWDLEYSVYREITDSRLIALLELYQ